MRALLLAALALAVLSGGCFKPQPHEGFACGPDNWCPDPLSCAGDHTCRSTDSDGGISGGDDGGGGSGDGGGGLPNFAFVTSKTYLAASLANVAAADKECTDVAHGQNLPGNFVAWLSTGTNTVISRMGTASGWLRRDGQVFASDRAGLLSGAILYPLRKTESGQDLVGRVMTGTNDVGVDIGENCQGLSSPSGTDIIMTGTSDSGTSTWVVDAEATCDQMWHLYCLQIDHARTLTPAKAPGMRAFLSTTYTVTGGLAAADARCQQNADAQSLGGKFRALLSTTTNAATDRFQPLPAQPWVRLDGVPTTRDFVTWEAPIDLTADRVYTSDTVFGGAANPNAKAASTTDTCNNWLGGNGAIAGISSKTGAKAFDATTTGCASSRLYCLEIP